MVGAFDNIRLKVSRLTIRDDSMARVDSEFDFWTVMGLDCTNYSVETINNTRTRKWSIARSACTTRELIEARCDRCSLWRPRLAFFTKQVTSDV